MNECEAGTTWWRPDREAVAASTPAADAGRVAFGGLVVFTIILLLAPQTMFPALKVLRIAFLAAGVAIGAHLLDATMRRTSFFPAGNEITIALALLSWTVLTIPFSYWPGGSIALLTDQYLKALVFFWLIGALVTTRERLRTFCWTLAMCSIPLAGMALNHFATGDFLYTGTAVRRISGYSGLSGNPNDLALTLNLLIPIAAMLLLTSRTMAGRLAASGALLLSIPAVIVTFSRAGFLTLAASALVGAIGMMRRRAAGAAIALVVVAACAWPLLPAGYVERLTTIVDIEADPTGSAQGRWNDFQVATDLVVQNPILGVGLGQDILALNEARGRKTWRSVHNAFLQYAVDLGVPGLALFTWLLMASLRSARRVEKYTLRKPALRDLSIFAVGVQVSLVAFAVAAFFHPIAYQFYFFSVAGLAVALKTACRAEVASVRAETSVS